MIKKLIILTLIYNTNLVFAKTVKFSVDMTGQTISANGVHLSGDLQTEAGFPTDWDSETTVMSREKGTDIYSVTLNIPAFRKYEYKFVNGDKFYEVEFVPEKSRVGYDFNDNRWIYIDSASTDVTILPALVFGGNAPTGKKMVKFVVDVQNQFAVDGKGIHVAGSFQTWDLSTAPFLFSFGNKVHEYVAYLDTTFYSYKFLNGLAEDKYETVTGSCANGNGNRSIKVNSDTVLSEVCFSKCTDCAASIFKTEKTGNFATLYPNPSNGITNLKINNQTGLFNVKIKDFTGRVISEYSNITNSFPINTSQFDSGIYLIDISNNTNLHTTLKLIVE